MKHKYLSYAIDLEFFSRGTHTPRDRVSRRRDSKQIARERHFYHFGEVNILDILKSVNAIEGVDDKGFDVGSAAVLTIESTYDEDQEVEIVDLKEGVNVSPALWAYNAVYSKKRDLITQSRLKVETESVVEAIRKALTGSDSDEDEDEDEYELQFPLEDVKAFLHKGAYTLLKHMKLYTDHKEFFHLDEKENFIEISKIFADSFFIDDLESVQETVLLKDYLDATSQEYKRKGAIDIDSDAIWLKDILSKDKFPLGRWPSKFYPSTMQQVAVNLASSNLGEPLVAVNGPPGTGKTTLLKEIIAATIVSRAEVIAGYSTPDAAFDKTECDKSKDDYFYKPKKELRAFGMIVASSNNTAVENISKELPLTKSIKGCLCPEEIVDYYAETAQSIVIGNTAEDLNEDDGCWGLISLALGKSENVSKALSCLGYKTYEEETKKEENKDKGKEEEKLHLKTLRDYIEDNEYSFEAAKKEFNDAKQQLEESRAKLNWPVGNQFYKSAAATSKVINYKGLRKSAPDEAMEKMIAEWQQAQKGIDDERKNTDFKDYNRLRELLFWKALKLHMAFASGSKCLQKNLLLFSDEIGKNKKKRNAKAYSSLLNSFMLVVPVISTTFASMHNMLSAVGKEELGYLIIDEAGQALPHFAIGGLYRFQRAVVVGDPFQVEPIEALPGCVDEFIRDMHGIDHLSSIRPNESVQTVADRLARFHGVRNFMIDSEMVIGCPLVVHRRCEDPMFSMSNRLAYKGIMINETGHDDDYKPFVIEDSCWYDIKGKESGKSKGGKGNRSVPAQTEFVVNLIGDKVLEFLTGENGKGEKEEDERLFIISPFTTVVDSIVDALLETPALKARGNKEKNRRELEKRIGTVHTFQGKQANEVIIVLGCDSSSKNSANWVGQKPNIMNVAVSRAKKRIAVIGDTDLWSKVDNVKTVFSALKGNIKKQGSGLEYKISYKNTNKGWANLYLTLPEETIELGWNLSGKVFSRQSREKMNEVNPKLEPELASLFKALTEEEMKRKFPMIESQRFKPEARRQDVEAVASSPKPVYNVHKKTEGPSKPAESTAKPATSNRSWTYKEYTFTVDNINQATGYWNISFDYKGKTVKFGIGPNAYLPNPSYKILVKLDNSLPKLVQEAFNAYRDKGNT